MSLPLADIKVVDFSQLYAGPTTTMLLADQGAQVIKVEPPEGDSARAVSPIPGTNGLSPGYLALNRNKRSIVLDLDRPKGLEVAHRLARWADVAICNPASNARHQPGIGYEDLASINPRLIYASITGYGERGPDADLPGDDIAIQRRSARLTNGRLPDGTLVLNITPYSYMSSGILNAYAITVALSERESTGKGQKIETNFFHTSLVLQSVQLIKSRRDGQDELAPRFPGAVNSFRCSDGKYIQLNVVAHHWRRYCRAMGLEHMRKDPFDTPPKRTERRQIIHDTFSSRFITKTSSEWEDILNEATVPATVVQDSVQGVLDDSQIVANQMFTEFQQPGLGPVTVVNTPFSLSGSKDEPRFLRHAPEKGEHTVEVLLELGYIQDEVQALKAEGAVDGEKT